MLLWQLKLESMRCYSYKGWQIIMCLSGRHSLGPSFQGRVVAGLKLQTWSVSCHSPVVFTSVRHTGSFYRRTWHWLDISWSQITQTSVRSEFLGLQSKNLRSRQSKENVFYFTLILNCDTSIKWRLLRSLVKHQIWLRCQAVLASIV